MREFVSMRHTDNNIYVVSVGLKVEIHKIHEIHQNFTLNSSLCNKIHLYEAEII